MDNRRYLTDSDRRKSVVEAAQYHSLWHCMGRPVPSCELPSDEDDNELSFDRYSCHVYAEKDQHRKCLDSEVLLRASILVWALTRCEDLGYLSGMPLILYLHSIRFILS